MADDANEALAISEVFLAEILLRSPRKLYIFWSWKHVCRINVSTKAFKLILKETSPLATEAVAVEAAASTQSPLVAMRSVDNTDVAERSNHLLPQFMWYYVSYVLVDDQVNEALATDAVTVEGAVAT